MTDSQYSTGDELFADMPPLMTVRQAADRLGLSTRWLREEIQRGALEVIEFSPRRRRVTRDQLAAYLQSRRVRHADPTRPLDVAGFDVGGLTVPGEGGEDVFAADLEPVDQPDPLLAGLTPRSRRAQDRPPPLKVVVNR